MDLLIKLIGIFCLVVSSQTTYAAISNGSFETPVVPISSYINYPAGSNLISNWTVVGIDSSLINRQFSQNGITFQAQDGNQWLDLAGVTSNSKLSGVTQNIPTTASSAYDLQFYVGSATDNVFFFPATVDVSINDGPRISHTNPTAPTNALNWQLFSLKFVAQSASTKVTFYNGSAVNNFIAPLDNITITPIASISSQVPLPDWTIPGLGILLILTAIAARAKLIRN